VLPKEHSYENSRTEALRFERLRCRRDLRGLRRIDTVPKPYREGARGQRDYLKAGRVAKFRDA
jgi:hypothetical protein